MTHVADKQQRASVQRNFRAIGGGVMTIVIQFTHDLPTVFFHFLLQSPLHQTQQIAVQQDFIFRINRRDRIFAVENGTDGRFDDNIVDVRRIVFANPPVGIDLQLNMQAVIFQQNAGRRSGIATVTDKLRRGA